MRAIDIAIAALWLALIVAAAASAGCGRTQASVTVNAYIIDDGPGRPPKCYKVVEGRTCHGRGKQKVCRPDGDTLVEIPCSEVPSDDSSN